jgi:hypothetical protein
MGVSGVDASQACVYLYRGVSSPQIRYVGRGASPDRALQHTGGSHNSGLRKLIETGKYVLEVAGPYSSPAEAALVEAALISALSQSGTQAALENVVAGTGPKFRPLGVPGELAERTLMPPLTLAEIGQVTGGGLLVRNSFGSDLSDGRPRLDPLSQQQDAVIVDNLVRFWWLERIVPTWAADPRSRPYALLGSAGPLTHRYVAGALRINRDVLCEEPVREITPIGRDLDAFELRGRRVADAKFGQGKHQHFIWVDGNGAVRYGMQTGWTVS